MIFTAIKQKMIIYLMLLAFIASIEASNSTVLAHRSNEERLDSIEVNLDLLEERVKSTLMGGGSKPVSFHGEARIKFQFHHAFQYPDFMSAHKSDISAASAPYFSGDKHRMSAGYDEAAFRLGMVVKPGRNTVLWGKLGFSQNFSGNKYYSGFYNDPSDTFGVTTHPENDYYQLAEQTHENHEWSVNVFEDMCAGFYLRTVPASFLIKMGNINWTEASPLSIWKGNSRIFAWDYLPYEIEQPIARYYEYAMAKGKKVGRAAWHKKAFNGLNIEAISLPADLSFNFLMGRYGNFDTFEREYIDFATELAYAAEWPGDKDGAIIETGMGDSYRKIYHMRLAKKMKDLIIGGNVNLFNTDENIIFAHQTKFYFYNAIFDINQNGTDTSSWSDNGDDIGKVFIKEPRNISIDLSGKLNEKLSLHADVGLSWIDTTWLWADRDKNTTYTSPMAVKKRESSVSKVSPAVYAKLQYNSKVEVGADLIFAGKGFYSPYSFIHPMDAFWAFGSNMTNAGTFAGKNENSPYVQNMTGALLTIEPKLKGYGHLNFKYGQHFQIKEARDLLYIPYRLNGMDIRSTMLSSYSRWGISTYNYTYKRGYKRRLGDESYDPAIARTAGADYKNGNEEYEWARAIEEGPEQGGIRADYLSVFEGFVPFESGEQALLNFLSRRGDFSNSSPLDRYRIITGSTSPFRNDLDSIGYIDEKGNKVTAETIFNTEDTRIDSEGFVPVHRKHTFNFEMDAAYDIGRLIGYKKDFFLSGYAAINGVSKKIQPLAFGSENENTLLWGLYLRFEPAIAITNKFYILGLAGYERWMSEKTWMNINYTHSIEGNVQAPKDVYGNQLTLENRMLPVLKNVPLDYIDYAFGLGFDWDMLEKVGLHMRCKYFMHKDANESFNNMEDFLVSLELKTFF